jgi:plasmid stability protein
MGETFASILLVIEPRGINTLVLRQVPDHLYRRLKAIASSNRRSMNQEAIVALAAGLPGEPPPQRPDVETSRRWRPGFDPGAVSVIRPSRTCPEGPPNFGKACQASQSGLNLGPLTP